MHSCTPPRIRVGKRLATPLFVFFVSVYTTFSLVLLLRYGASGGLHSLGEEQSDVLGEIHVSNMYPSEPTNDASFSHAESTGAIANCSDPKLAPLGGDIIAVSCHLLPFQIDRQTFSNAKGTYWNVIVGVLSLPSNAKRRKAIRETWAKDKSGVFFVVAGDWELISDEFFAFGDLIWIDEKEHFHKITFKTSAFFVVVDRLTREFNINYNYALKTDDDSYVAMDRVSALLEHLGEDKAVRPDYIGRCNDGISPIRDVEHKYYTSWEEYPEKMFPAYCQGCGYLLSNMFVKCLSSHHNVGTLRYLKHEDVFVGLLAQRCGVTNIHFIDEYHVRPFRTGLSQGNAFVAKEKERINSNGDPVDDEELPVPEMAARMIQHRINSDADMVRHYKSHHDSRLILSSEDIFTGELVEYYYNDDYGWLGADVKIVSDFNFEEASERRTHLGNSSNWLQVSLYFRLDQTYETVPYVPFLGTMRKSSRHRNILTPRNSSHYQHYDIDAVQSQYDKPEAYRQKKRHHSDIELKNRSISFSANLQGHLRTLNITEKNGLFRKTFYPLLENYLCDIEFANSSLSTSMSKGCGKDSAEDTYMKTMRAVMVHLNENKDFDNIHWGALHPCPLTLLFYYEETDTKQFSDFLQFYRRFDSRCIKFAVPWDFVDSDKIDFYEKNYGIQFIQSSARYSDQNKVINDALSIIRGSCGPYCLVSVNDMDHYLVWQHSGGGPTGLESAFKKFYKYSSYSDAAMLYMYSFLSAPGCGNKNVRETMVAPCTCLLENNTEYRHIREPFFSEYGKNNMFHPSMNFWVDPKFVDSVGTVFSNLDSPLEAVAHHTVGEHLPLSKLKNPINPSVLHLRKVGGILPSLGRYAEYLDGDKRNYWSSNDGTIAEARACVRRHPKWVIQNKRLCGKVKEISNILAALRQRNRCLGAGVDRFICDVELPCCATFVTESCHTDSEQSEDYGDSGEYTDGSDESDKH